MKKNFPLISIFLFALILPFLLFAFSDGPRKGYRSQKVAWLGISTQTLTPQLRAFFGADEDTGVLVSEIAEDSPAETHGLKAGDVITEVDGEQVSRSREIEQIIHDFDPGEMVTIGFIRDRQKQVLKIVLGERDRYRHPYYGFHPEKMEIVIPDGDIDIPEIEFEIPEFDEEELEELHNELREELEHHQFELQEGLQELKENLKRMKVEIKSRSSEVI